MKTKEQAPKRPVVLKIPKEVKWVNRRNMRRIRISGKR